VDHQAPTTGHAEKLDLDAYLERIGYRAGREPTLETLAAIHTAHLSQIPFENIDVRLGRPISLDIAELESKLVARRRGGYCFEQNTLFAAVLSQLGFAVSTLEARVRPPGAAAPLPRTHMLLQATVGERRWLADVGFGGDGPLEPVPLDGTAARQSVATFRVVKESTTAHVLQTDLGQGWRDLYSFTLVPALPVDFAVANHFTSTHPQSIFMRTLTVQRSEPHRRLILRGRTFVERQAQAERSRDLTDSEVPELLREVFGLEVDDAEVSTALGTPTPV
jgi:N-hydroxyarylamine O-acetyltransferase